MSPTTSSILRVTALATLLTVAPATAAPATHDQAPKADEGVTKASPVEPLPYLEQLPPLLDRDLFFGDPEISGSQISPDGRHVSFIKPYNDVRNVWVVERGAPFDDGRPLTADTERPVTGYFWSEDSEYVLYVQDKGGDENYHVYAVDPDAEPEESTGVPPARDLTPLENVRAYIYAVPEATPNEILVGLNDRDPALHDVYRVKIDSGERELVIKNEQNVAAWITDLSGDVRLAYRQTPDGGTEMLAVEDGELGKAIYTCAFEESCSPIRFHEDGERVYIESNRSTEDEEVDLTRLLLMDATTGATELVESDPENEVDFGGALFSDATEELIATTYLGDRLRIYPKTEKMKRALDFLRRELPDGELSIGSLTNDDRYAKVVVSRDVDPGTVYLLDWQEMTVEELYQSRPDLPSEHLAPMKAFRYPARDGVEIPAYLTIPKGVEAKDLAVVVNPHGGPWSRDTWGYDPLHQFLANRGYAVLSMNFRGSTGYGKAFLNAGNEEWGTGVMQHDISDGVKHLIEKEIADPNRVAIMGGSYGGYATLAGLAFTPELYTAGVDIVGPSNIITLINSIPPYWGPFRKMFTLRVGDPDDPDDEKRLKAQSPLFHVDRIDDPLLVIQGANDPRVKQAEADQIVVALREAEQPVEYLVAPDEGHGFAGRENRLAMYAKIEQFLAAHLGGRAQSEMAPDIAAHLAEITVDVSSVEMPEPASEADAARTVPLPPVDPSRLLTGELAYSSSLAMGEREMVIDSRRTVASESRDGEEVLVATTLTTMPMGETRDVYVLDADSLRPRSRRSEQGPVTVEVAYDDTTVSGAITAQGQEIPIDVELEAPIFGDEAALGLVIAALPLSEGYDTTLRTFEVGMQQRVRLWSLEVAGSEELEVPAGTYDTWKVVVEPLDGEGGGQTVWVPKQTPRAVVRVEGELPPQMGGGTVTTELTAAPE